MANDKCKVLFKLWKMLFCLYMNDPVLLELPTLIFDSNSTVNVQVKKTT